ncbi:hypothetical protein HZS_5844 [Henneguya salminicola]|nr:hypothetical protein HZS_5844 [Henneguya salminicola]
MCASNKCSMQDQFICHIEMNKIGISYHIFLLFWISLFSILILMIYVFFKKKIHRYIIYNKRISNFKNSDLFRSGKNAESYIIAIKHRTFNQKYIYFKG